MTEAIEVARASSTRGEIVLLRRGRDRALELRVNGVFVMDTAETASERQLARTALQAAQAASQGPASRGLRVLIGGLGLGFTLDEVLRDPAVGDVVVVEIEAALVGWHRAGLVPQTARASRDARVRIEVGDVMRAVEHAVSGSVDVILLDIDNGPGYLVYDANAELYRAPFLRACCRATGPDGVTAVWSNDASPKLSAAMTEAFGAVQEVVLPVRLGARESTYHLFLGRRR